MTMHGNSLCRHIHVRKPVMCFIGSMFKWCLYYFVHDDYERFLNPVSVLFQVFARTSVPAATMRSHRGVHWSHTNANCTAWSGSSVTRNDGARRTCARNADTRQGSRKGTSTICRRTIHTVRPWGEPMTEDCLSSQSRSTVSHQTHSIRAISLHPPKTLAAPCTRKMAAVVNRVLIRQMTAPCICKMEAAVNRV